MSTIIIEGPDAVGKTTLVTALQKHYGCASVKMKKEDTFDDVARAEVKAIHIAAMCKEHNMHCIFDRHWISEICYGPLYHNRTDKDAEYIMDVIKGGLEETLNNLLYVICLPSEQDCLKLHEKSYLDRQEDYKPDEQYQYLIKNYHQIYDDGMYDIEPLRLQKNVLRYDITSTSVDDMVKTIAERLDR